MVGAFGADLMPCMPLRPQASPVVDPDKALDENDSFVQELRRLHDQP